MARRKEATQRPQRDPLDVFELEIAAWFADSHLSQCSPAARGVWVDLLLRMQKAGRSGQIEGTVQEIARLARCTVDEAVEALLELRARQAADVEGRITRGTRAAAAFVVVRNRRMVRELRAREDARERKRKQRDAGGDDPEAWLAVRHRILQRDRHRCGYCGESAGTVDHVLPLSQGGDDRDSNLVAACGKCNGIKGKRTPEKAGLTLLPEAKARLVTRASQESAAGIHALVPVNVTPPPDSPSLSPPHRDKRVTDGGTGGTWPSLIALLATRIDAEDLATWFRPLRVVADEPARLALHAPNLHFVDAIESHRRALDAAATELRPGLAVTVAAAARARR